MCRPIAPRNTRSFQARQRGSATIEFALLAMAMITVMFGASEYGRVMYQYDTIVKSARSSARYASNAASSASAVTEAKNLVVYGSTTAGTSGSELVPGLTTGKVAVTYAASGTDATINTVTVSVTGLEFQPAASWLVSPFNFGTITAVMTQLK